MIGLEMININICKFMSSYYRHKAMNTLLTLDLLMYVTDLAEMWCSMKPIA